MLDYIAVVLMVSVALFGAAYSLYRTLSGKSKDACGCGSQGACCSQTKKDGTQLVTIQGIRS